jgi:lysophospholipase L1-like esterase
LGGYTPDVVLVLLGTSDGDAGDTVENMVTEASQIFEILRASNPNVIIVWGQPDEAWDPYPAFRVAMEARIATATTAESPIVVVDHSPGWISDPDAPGTHTLDWTHTNPAGDARLANNWMSVLRPLLGIP